MTGVLNEAGNANVDQVVLINANTGNTFFDRLGLYDQMIVLARSGNDVPTVIQEMNRLYGSDSFGIVSPAATALYTGLFSIRLFHQIDYIKRFSR